MKAPRISQSGVFCFNPNHLGQNNPNRHRCQWEQLSFSKQNTSSKLIFAGR
ncbi:hypothetical protein NC99_15680 [Sunxiuqinia dokdonensis]|uniref:Uncharacterized protein n=1 Tax=Sunxiuqinia dokdonensis TaxID=1409788 RepID=A0A0L8VAY6_9BACT|nr:hypothetical protein NC99_15680 [Sunxiuqinia dokdonensis]